MSIAPTPTANSSELVEEKAETEKEKAEKAADAEKERLRLERLAAAAERIGERIWSHNIETESGLSLALIANQMNSGANSRDEFIGAIGAWVRAKHGKKLAKIFYTPALKTVLRRSS